MLHWMSRSRLTKTAWIVTSISLLGNVSFFLFCRQCRYYPLSMLLSIVIAYLYLNWNGRWRTIFGMTTASILLMLTNYIPFAGLYMAMACDYFLVQAMSEAIERDAVGHTGRTAVACGPDDAMDLQSIGRKNGE